MTIDELVRPHLRHFKPYVGRDAMAGALLDANELTAGSPLADVDGPYNRYPDAEYLVVREALAALVGLSAVQTFAATGSDEVIDLLVRLVCEPGRDNIVALSPSFGMYRTWAQVSGVEFREAPLDDSMHLDVDAIVRATDERTKLVFCCSPNNPTGNTLDADAILSLRQRVRGLVVVDHAYIEFSDGGDVTSSVAQSDNLVVLRTLSKAWGLAGLRVGYAFGPVQLVNYLNAIRAPYHMSNPAQQLALEALMHREFPRVQAMLVRERRAELEVALRSIPSVRKVYRSDANFLLVAFNDVDRAYRSLLSASIAVRRRSEERLRDCLRITVGSRDENARVIQALFASAP